MSRIGSIIACFVLVPSAVALVLLLYHFSVSLKRDKIGFALPFVVVIIIDVSVSRTVHLNKAKQEWDQQITIEFLINVPWQRKINSTEIIWSLGGTFLWIFSIISCSTAHSSCHLLPMCLILSKCGVQGNGKEMLCTSGSFPIKT